jgi:hypothetical protein
MISFDTWPAAHHARNAKAALPVGVFFTAERSDTAVRPGIVMRTIVRGIDDDGVVVDAEFFELIEQDADVLVMLDHPGAVYTEFLKILL